MPLFEYTCKQCGYAFELLILGNEEVCCPECGSKEVQKGISAPAAFTGCSISSSGDFT